MALSYLRRKNHDDDEILGRRIEPRLGPEPGGAKSEVFDSGRKTIVDCAHVKVERLETYPVLFSKVFKEFEDWQGQKYDYRYWAERENFFLREFLKKQNEFTHVVQARHLISENEAAKQVLTCDAGITIANWLRVKSRYTDTATLSHPFQRSDAFLRLLRACLVALKQIHDHRIVHCDIKEDNICIPYAPNPFPGNGRKIHLEFENLKLIDFAFSVAHAIPLTQILVINPDERVPYQSELLISALRSDRRSGSPNAVQQLDYRVDLFSLGYMAEKISAAGLDCPPGPGDRRERSRALEDVRSLVRKLKAFDSTPNIGSLPHDALIAEIDRLLVETAGLSESLEFKVDGEWTAEEMAQGRGAGRKTPLTPVALPLPTPVSLALAHAPHLSGGLSGIRIPLLLGLALAVAGGGLFAYREAGDTGPPSVSSALIEKKETPLAQPPPTSGPDAKPVAPGAAPTPLQTSPNAPAEAGNRIVSLLRSDEDLVFQAAFGDLTQLMTSSEPAAVAIAESIAAEYGDALAPSGSQARRSHALGRLIWMAKAGNTFAAQRVAAFEKYYDEVKQTVAKSDWWVRGQGPQPEEAARWMENGELLAETGDRPAMLDLAFAMGHGRALKQDRVTSVETYLKVIARSDRGDEISARIRQSAVRGLAAMLDIIVEQKDQDSAKRLLPALESKADSGAAGMQYYLGLLSECVTRPANLDAARQWYRRAAADPAWKRSADHKARVLGRWCPHRSI
jgi:serine/threonine protein kinase